MPMRKSQAMIGGRPLLRSGSWPCRTNSYHWNCLKSVAELELLDILTELLDLIERYLLERCSFGGTFQLL